MVRRQLRAIAALKLDEDASEHPEAIDTLEHRALNREAARSGFVLLKNDNNILPLDRSKVRRIAVVGPRGGLVDGGGGSAHVTATHRFRWSMRSAKPWATRCGSTSRLAR